MLEKKESLSLKNLGIDTNQEYVVFYVGIVPFVHRKDLSHSIELK